MVDLNIVIRGHIYHPNWNPVHFPCPDYKIDFRKVQQGYVKLVQQLSTKYSVQTYFSTYDISKVSGHTKILNQFSTYKDCLISPFENSDQFTTVLKAITELKPKLTLFIRSDIFITDEFINIILQKQPNEIQEHVHLLSLEYAPHENLKIGDNAIDVIQIVPKHLLSKFKDYIEQIDREDKEKYKQIIHKLPNNFKFPCNHAHDLHKYVTCKMLYKKEDCKSTYDCGKLFTIYRG